MVIDADFENKKFPYNESDTFEFKESIIEKLFGKYLETICGFLNTKGGYLIFGIKDTLDLQGLKIKQKELDYFILRIDSIINSNQIIGINIITNEFIKLKPSNLKISQITNSSSNKFLSIKVFPDPDIKYQLANGIIYYRLGASNYFEKTEKIFKQSDFESACKNIQIKAEEENRSNIELFQKTLEEKNSNIQQLHKQIEEVSKINLIYKTHLESSLNIQNNNNNQKPNTHIIQYSYSNIYSNIIEKYFPCFK